MLFRNDKKDNPGAAAVVPLLPLRELIVFPHEVYPIFVGRQKSIKALEASEASKRPTLLVAQKDAKVADPQSGDLYNVGTLGVVVQLLRDYLPAGQDFVIRNLNALVNARHRAQVFSLLILLITSTGVFMPLEVALNRIWRFPDNRSYLGNQLIALGLAFGCGVLALISVALTAGNVVLLKTLTFGHVFLTIRLLGFLIMKLSLPSPPVSQFLSDLLAIAKRQSAGPGGRASGGDHGIALGNLEILLHPGAAATGFLGSLWALRIVR